MKSFRRTFLGIAAASVMVGLWSAGAQAQEVTLRFHQQLPAMATIPKLAIQPWIEAVEKASKGRIKIQRFDSMSLGGKPNQAFDQVKDGFVDFTWTVLSYTPGRFPKTEVFELPFMTRDATRGSMALQDFVERNAADEFKEVKLIAAHIHGPGAFHTLTPIQKYEDLKGLRIRGAGRVINELISALGGSPIGMPITSVAESLSKGVLDGTTIPFEIVPAFKIQQLVKNHTMFANGTALYTNTFAIVMNKASYEKLPPDLKKVINDHSGQYAAKLFGGAMDKGDAVGLDLIKKAKNNVIVIDETEMQRWRRTAAVVTDSWVERTSKLGFDAKAMLADARNTIKKYEK